MELQRRNNLLILTGPVATPGLKQTDKQMMPKEIKAPNGEVVMKLIVEAPKMGQYKETTIDKQKREVDFLLKSVNPYFIRWKDGRGETVNKRQLTKLQAQHTWMTDF